MRKWLLLTSALVCLNTTPAHADPITGAIAGAIGFTAGTTAFALATGVMQIAGSVLLSTVAQKLAGKPKAEIQRGELTRVTALPAHRYVYGDCWAPGTPVAWKVNGRILFVCYLLNSRPSALTRHQVYFDGRPTAGHGDPFDFNSIGLTVANIPYVGWGHYWIGRGDQTTCPAQVVAGSGGYFKSTDAWTGRTVLWARFDCGPDGERSIRWPATPPQVQVDGNWSLVHDPRDNSIGPTRNQALIVRDALRHNPIRPYADVYLWDETFAWAANVADEAVRNADGSDTPRYRADGILVWSNGTELEDQIGPLLAAGGARLVRVGGRLGLVPACHRAAVHTISDYTDSQPLELARWQPADDLYTECVATYTAPDRSFESAEAPVYVVPGAQEADGGLVKRMDLALDFVIDHRQARRLAKIAVMRSRMQRTLSAELYPDAFKLVAGSVATVSLPAPYTAWNSDYEVESINPSAGINDDESIRLRLPVTLRETSPEIYAWDAAREEVAVDATNYDPVLPFIQPPAAISVASGGDAALISGGLVTPRVRLEWVATEGSSVTGYEWQYTVTPANQPGGLAWLDGGFTSATGARRAWIAQVMVGDTYRVRVRAAGLYGRSDWIESADILAAGPTGTLASPAILLAVGGAGQIDLTLRQADDAAATQLEVWGAALADPDAAVLLTSLAAGANVTATYSELDLGPAETRYYWARSSNGFGAISAFSASASATT